MNNKVTGMIFLVIAIFVGIVILNNRYNTLMKEKKVICDFDIDYSNYEEKVTFVFKENKIVKYYRNEEFYRTEDKNIDEIYNYFLEIANQYEPSDSFKYTVKKVKDIVYIDTYIDAVEQSAMFEDYVGGLGIRSSFNPEQVKRKLDSTNYKCTIQ